MYELNNVFKILNWVINYKLDCGRGDEGSIPFNDIFDLVLNDYNMITSVINDYKMTTHFYFKCKSMWTLHIIVLDMTWHHVMLNSLSKLFNVTLVTIVI